MRQSASELLLGVILGAADTSLVHVGNHEGTTGTFEIFGNGIYGGYTPLASTDDFNIFATRFPSGQMGLMKISKTPEAVTLLLKEEKTLRTLQAISAQIDEDSIRKGGNAFYYGSMFPRVHDSFHETDVTVLFLGFDPNTIASYRQFVPLSVLTHERRVDIQTSVWILGKALKLLDFLHSNGYTLGFIDGTNMFLETSLHGVFMLDFSSADAVTSQEAQRAEVITLAHIVWEAVGGTDSSDPPFANQQMTSTDFTDFIAFFKHLTNGVSAIEAHKALYELAERIWGKGEKKASGNYGRPFHPYISYPR